MGLTLSQGLYLAPEQRLEQRCNFYSTEGDIELLSLHRIKNRIKTLEIHKVTRGKLISEILVENSEYRKQWENNWYCLTPIRLDNAITATVDFLQAGSDEGISTLEKSIQPVAKTIMDKLVKNQEEKIKQWFSNNYDNILYDREANIPYPIVMAMRRSFRAWAFEKADPFLTPISEFVEEVALNNGLNPESYEDYQDVWNALRDIKKK